MALAAGAFFVWILIGFGYAYGFHLAGTPSIFNAQRNVTITFRPGASDNKTSPGAYPNDVTIYIGQMTNVVWQNDDSTTHRVVSDNGTFGSSTLANGEFYTFHFSTPGVYSWHDPTHPWIKGVITVVG
jgi:plastocyanin